MLDEKYLHEWCKHLNLSDDVKGKLIEFMKQVCKEIEATCWGIRTATSPFLAALLGSTTEEIETLTEIFSTYEKASNTWTDELRICKKCNKYMVDGYVYDGHYYCDDDCLEGLVPTDEAAREELYELDNGDFFFYSEWYDSEVYCIIEETENGLYLQQFTNSFDAYKVAVPKLAKVEVRQIDFDLPVYKQNEQGEIVAIKELFPEKHNKVVEMRKKHFYTGATVSVMQNIDDPYTPIPKGTKGIVRLVDDMGQVHATWENGCSIAAITEDWIELVK